MGEIKVVSIATLNTGGAGIAAFRLHLSLLSSDGIGAYFLQKQYESVDKDAKIDYVPERSSLFYRLKRKLRLTPEYKNRKLVPKYSANHEYEIATFPTTSYRIEDHPLIKEADIIHLHWVADFLNYPSFFKKVKKPIVWTLHDKNPFHGIFHTEMDEINNSKCYGEVDKRIIQNKINYLKQITNLHIVTPSLWLLNKSSKSVALGSFPHYCIANSIDLGLYNISHNEAKMQLNVFNQKKTLMFIAHSIDIPRRGFSIMQEAFIQLEDELCDFNLITVGGNKIELNIPSINHIHYNSTNDTSLLNTIYSASDIQILPTMEDNLPNVMLESFANGTPVISFANGGMAEHIITGENGILVDTIGAEPLKTAIEDFLNNKYTFNRESIRQYAKDHFDKDQQTQKYIDLYKQILKK